MSAPDSKPKVEGRRAFRRPNNATVKKKEYVSTNTGVEAFTFDVGHPKYAAKYQQHLEALALHIQEKYQNGSSIAKSIRDMKLETRRYQTRRVPTSRRWVGGTAQREAGTLMAANRQRPSEGTKDACREREEGVRLDNGAMFPDAGQ